MRVGTPPSGDFIPAYIELVILWAGVYLNWCNQYYTTVPVHKHRIVIFMFYRILYWATLCYILCHIGMRTTGILSQILLVSVIGTFGLTVWTTVKWLHKTITDIDK